MIRYLLLLFLFLVSSGRCVSLSAIFRERRSFLSQLISLSSLLPSSSRAETLSNGEDVDAYVRDHIKGSDVMVFAKSYCPVSHPLHVITAWP